MSAELDPSSHIGMYLWMHCTASEVEQSQRYEALHASHFPCKRAVMKYCSSAGSSHPLELINQGTCSSHLLGLNSHQLLSSVCTSFFPFFMRKDTAGGLVQIRYDLKIDLFRWMRCDKSSLPGRITPQ